MCFQHQFSLYFSCATEINFAHQAWQQQPLIWLAPAHITLPRQPTKSHWGRDLHKESTSVMTSPPQCRAHPLTWETRASSHQAKSYCWTKGRRSCNNQQLNMHECFSHVFWLRFHFGVHARRRQEWRYSDRSVLKLWACQSQILDI